MLDTSKHPLRIEGGPAAQGGLVALAVTVSERMNAPREIGVRIASADQKVTLEDLVGAEFTVIVEADGEELRRHAGVCVSAGYAGNGENGALYDLDLRSGLWFLGRTQECRIFQDATAVDVVMEVLGEYGLAKDVEKRLSRTPPSRTICVQYRESDLAFVDRLLEAEGICYFLEEDGQGGEKMILADSSGAHEPIEGGDLIPFHPVTGGNTPEGRFVTDWRGEGRATSGRVTLKDYNFLKPGAGLEAGKAMPVGKHREKDRERYDYPGGYAEQSDGDEIVRIRMEEEAARARLFRASSNVAKLSVGRTFRVDRHPRIPSGEAQLVTAVRRAYALSFRDEPDAGAAALSGAVPTLAADALMIEGLEARTQFRPARVTPAPRIAGVQTAVVTGPSGEEIHTDAHARVRVQFHWDRLGGGDEKSTCWVRVATPWSGRNWGAIAVPRIGQEVVVQFEEGDPDRPLVTGMLYNAETMPPWDLPANKTQSGVKTNSSKGGGGFNELMMEDKKGAELVRFQAERDFQQIVKNDATVTVGLETAAKGDFTMTVKNDSTTTVQHDTNHTTHRNLTEKVGLIQNNFIGVMTDTAAPLMGEICMMKQSSTAWHSFESVGTSHLSGREKLDFGLDLAMVAAGYKGLPVIGEFGSPIAAAYTAAKGRAAAKGFVAGKTLDVNGRYTVNVRRDRLETVDGVRHLEVGGDVGRTDHGGDPAYWLTVKDGDVETRVDQGAHRTRVKKKDHETRVDMGDVKVKADKGKVRIEAAQEIELKVGPSTLKMTPSKIELKIGSSTVTLDMSSVQAKGMQAKLIGDMVAKVDAVNTTISGDLTMVDGSMVMIN